jgi:hypothetical protein
MIAIASGTGLVGHCCNHLLRRSRRNGILVLVFGLGLTNLGGATMSVRAQTSANYLSSPPRRRTGPVCQTSRHMVRSLSLPQSIVRARASRTKAMSF